MKIPGRLAYIADENPTQLFGDSVVNHEIRIPEA